MISDKYKLIYVHIPRTSGHTISAILEYNIRKRQVERHAFPFEYQLAYPDKFNSYFKTTCIRNPMDRLISAWIRCSKLYSKNWRIIKDDHRKDDKFFNTRIKPEFNIFVKNDLRKFINTSHFRPQYLWFQNITYDYVIRFEHLEEDIEVLAKKIGMKETKWPKKVLSATRRRPWLEYYDKNSINIVESLLYKKDIGLWRKYNK